jgi:four helix bundle protein
LYRLRVQSPRNLLVYARALELAKSVYVTTADFPRDERFGLVSQMRRSAVSVGSNIAEGCGRRGDAELCRFLYYSMASASELGFQIELAQVLEFGAPSSLSECASNTEAIRKMLSRLIKRIEQADR